MLRTRSLGATLLVSVPVLVLVSASLSVLAGGCSEDAGAPADTSGEHAGERDAGPTGTPQDAGSSDEDADAGSDAAMEAAADAGCVRPDPGTSGDGDFVIGPTYKDAPELSPKADVPRGDLPSFTMSSKDSTIYPGKNGAYTRKVTVYVPKQYVDGSPAPLMIVQDGSGYVATLAPVLDSMIAAKELPPIVAVFIDSGGGDGRGSERGLEYDRVSEDYARFIETEVLPVVPKQASVKAVRKDLRFTKDPERRATMGGSSGGSAAFTMAWFRPDLYRRVLTFSGTFVNQYPEAAYPGGAWEYHAKLIPAAPVKPIRVQLEVGEKDNNLDPNYKDGMHDWVAANRAMAKVLAQKGYHYRFDFAEDAGHVDRRVVRQTLPKVLAWLWRGYDACPAEED